IAAALAVAVALGTCAADATWPMQDAATQADRLKACIQDVKTETGANDYFAMTSCVSGLGNAEWNDRVRAEQSDADLARLAREQRRLLQPFAGIWVINEFYHFAIVPEKLIVTFVHRPRDLMNYAFVADIEVLGPSKVLIRGTIPRTTITLTRYDTYINGM